MTYFRSDLVICRPSIDSIPHRDDSSVSSVKEADSAAHMCFPRTGCEWLTQARRMTLKDLDSNHTLFGDVRSANIGYKRTL